MSLSLCAGFYHLMVHAVFIIFTGAGIIIHLMKSNQDVQDVVGD